MNALIISGACVYSLGLWIFAIWPSKHAWHYDYVKGKGIIDTIDYALLMKNQFCVNNEYFNRVFQS